MKQRNHIISALAGLWIACGNPAVSPSPEEQHQIDVGQHEDPVRISDGGVVCENPKKVLICHIPPGNPDNAHSICVGAAAESAHLNHGDVLNACSPSATSDAGTPPGTINEGGPGNSNGQGNGPGNDGGSPGGQGNGPGGSGGSPDAGTPDIG